MIINKEIIISSFNNIKERGPDSFGLFVHYIDDNYELIFDDEINDWYPKNNFFCIIGFSRLSIRGLVKKYDQPYLKNGNITVFNGEIYNDQELSNSLNLPYKGGQGDIELVNNIFSSTRFLDHFIKYAEGMYAIANYNIKSKRVTFIRDLFGIKPLYKTLKNDSIYLSSSAIVCRKLSNTQKILSNKGLCNYLLFRSTGIGQTIFSDIYSIKGGIVYVYNESGIHEELKYELNDIFVKTKRNTTLDDNEVFSALNKSILQNCISDVGLTSTLSGGIDSTIVANTLTNHNIEHELFSVIVEEPGLSEEKYINHVCKILNNKSSKIILKNNVESESLKKIVEAMEEPVSHPNSIGIYNLCKKVQGKGNKVLLSGEGADELFCGYERSYWDFISCSLPNYADPYNFKVKGLKSQLKKILTGDLKNNILNIMCRMIYLDPYYLKRLIDKEIIRESLSQLYQELDSNISKFKAADFLVFHEIKNYLPSLLLRADKMSMASSLEMRVPFLSKDLLKKILSLKQKKRIKLLSLKGREGCKKIILKNYLSKKFGKEFTYRRKQGFTVPVENFINNDFAYNCLDKSEFKDLANEINKENKNRIDRLFFDRKIWPILSLAMAEINFKNS